MTDRMRSITEKGALLKGQCPKNADLGAIDRNAKSE